MGLPPTERPRHPAPREAGGATTRALALVLVGALVAVAIFVRATREADRPARLVVLFAYSALDDVLNDGLLPAFQRRWRAEHGEDVEFVTTFGGSRTLTERILREVPAQVAILTSTLDAQRLVPRVVRPRAWEDLPHGGVLARTPIVLRVRSGNPHGVVGFEDLGRMDLVVLRPDPTTSGLGECTLLAAYGATQREGGDARRALDVASALQAAAPPPTRTAREAMRRFRAGEGDVCVAYEHDTLETPSRPRLSGDVVRPAHTLVCEPVVVVVRRHVEDRDVPLVRAVTDFLWSDEARAILLAYGLHAPTTAASAMGVEGGFTLAEVHAPEDVLEAATTPPPAR